MDQKYIFFVYLGVPIGNLRNIIIFNNYENDRVNNI